MANDIKAIPTATGTDAWTAMLAERLPEFAHDIVRLANAERYHAEFTINIPLDASLHKCRDHLDVILQAMILSVGLCGTPRRVSVFVSIAEERAMMLSDKSRIAGFLDVKFVASQAQ